MASPFYFCYVLLQHILYFDNSLGGSNSGTHLTRGLSLKSLTPRILACPVKFLPSSTSLLLLFNRGFVENERSGFNWGLPPSFLDPLSFCLPPLSFIL